MNKIVELLQNLFKKLKEADFALLLTLDLCAFLAVTIIALAACSLSKTLKSADKRPYLHLVNVFTAVTLALLTVKFSFAESVFASALYWFTGYLFYGLLCALTPKKVKRAEWSGVPVTAAMQSAPRPDFVPAAPPAKNDVRLEHALSIADKLLLKPLGRGDRQELEKMKTALTVLKVKGSLTPQDGENLNQTFNALLKLMAKYDL